MQARSFLAVFPFLLFCLFVEDFSRFQNHAGENLPGFPNQIEYWLTTADQKILLTKQSQLLYFGKNSNKLQTIVVNSAKQYQTIDGFGYTLTGGSAELINGMEPAKKAALLNELFGNSPASISLSYLRLSIGASDLNRNSFSYDDIPEGSTDPDLSSFSLAPDLGGGTGLIPLLKEIKAINPTIKIIATPWSPPVWMKDNKNFKGGSLQPAYYDAYAKYFVKYIGQMAKEGITIDAITPQNEPLNPKNEPSLLMTAEQQRDFIKQSLGPAFKAAALKTKIIAYDHNCDRPDYAKTVLNDPAARAFVQGSAFHLYGGEIGVLSSLHHSYPDKELYFTEQWTGSKTAFDGDFQWHVRNVIMGSMRNWSRIALEWNLASDTGYAIHTPGGCTECKGAVTIDRSEVTRNVAYYIIAHASKFVPAGSVRIESNNSRFLNSVAFLRPDGKKVLIVLNDANQATEFNVRFNKRSFTLKLPASSVGSFLW